VKRKEDYSEIAKLKIKNKKEYSLLESFEKTMQKARKQEKSNKRKIGEESRYRRMVAAT